MRALLSNILGVLHMLWAGCQLGCKNMEHGKIGFMSEELYMINTMYTFQLVSDSDI